MSGPDFSKFVEVTVPVPSRPANVQAVAYCDKRERNGILGDNAGSIRLFMLISMFPSDHAIFYLFINDAPTVDQVKAFAELNKDEFGYRLAVVEMGQAFETIESAAEQAATLRDGFPNANVMFPPITLSSTLASQ